MNTASATSTVWTVVAVLLSIISVTGLTVLGIRRCLRSVTVHGNRAWRMAGFSVGAALLALAVVVLGVWLSDPVSRVGAWLLVIFASVALCLWGWCMWTDRAPASRWWPGIQGSKPHRPGWVVAVWLTVTAWGVLWWAMAPTTNPARSGGSPGVTEVVIVSAVTMGGGGLVVGFAQNVVRRSRMRAATAAARVTSTRLG